jgi:hypothetical protein
MIARNPGLPDHTGNVNDREPVPDLCKCLFGKLIANRGYIYQSLFGQLLETFNLQLITRIKKNMKSRLMPMIDKILLRKRAGLVTENELMRAMLDVCMQNKLLFRFVLFDTWFASKENMCHIKETLKKDFVCALKSNRLAAVSKEDYQANRFTPMDEPPWQEEKLYTGWLKDVLFPVLFVRQVFTNKDGSTGILYLACSDTTVTRKLILATYQKRWPVEVLP